MIDKGKKVFDGALSQLKHNYGQMRTFRFELLNPDDIGRLDYQKKFHLSDDDCSVEVKPPSVCVKFNSSLVSVEEMISYTLQSVHVKDIEIKDVEIEEVIKRLYRREVAI